MKTKQFNIGEYAVGGRIKITVDNKQVTVQALDWTTKKQVCMETFTLDQANKVEDYLTELSTSYYADEMMKWVTPLLPKKESYF